MWQKQEKYSTSRESTGLVIIKWSNYSVFFILYTHGYIYLGLWSGLHSQAFTIFSFRQEKHTFSSVINSCYWRLLFKGWYAAEEGTCSGRLWPGSQAPGDRGPAAEHWHIAGAPSRYLKGLCVIYYFLKFDLHGIHHVQHLLFFYFFSFSFSFLKKFCGLWFRLFIFGIEGLEGEGTTGCM